MTENGGPDILDQIDALTEPGEDAATWTAGGAHEVPEWNNPSPGTMTAILLDISAAAIVEISQTNPEEDVDRLVGDPFVNPISHLHAVNFWVGDNSVANAPVNQGATRFLHRLLGDVRDGDYVASDREREHAHGLLESPDRAPVIHGPCLITGVDATGDPGPLDENFQHWFTTILDGISYMRDAIGLAVAEALGIPPEHISEVVFVGLR